jgi:hypothetical protein
MPAFNRSRPPRTRSSEAALSEPEAVKPSVPSSTTVLPVCVLAADRSCVPAPRLYSQRPAVPPFWMTPLFSITPAGSTTLNMKA